jgi:hypothetical protein
MARRENYAVHSSAATPDVVPRYFGVEVEMQLDQERRTQCPSWARTWKRYITNVVPLGRVE